MAIIKDGKIEYAGRVIRVDEKYWSDGMLEETAVVWDMEAHEARYIPVAYYGSDCRNLYGNITAAADLGEEARRDILRTIKQTAPKAFERSVLAKKAAITKGTRAEVIKGRKIPKGTILTVFWSGERETFQSRRYSWMHETETVAGCYDEDGNKVWIKAEYLRNVDPIKSPCAAERRRFIKAYVKNTARTLYGIRVII